MQHVGAVLLCLLEHLLLVKTEKCEFYLSSVSFLEYMISLDPRLHPVKTSAVFNWPVPDTRKQLQWFLGQFLVALHPELQLHSGTPHHSYQCGRGPACGHLRTVGVGAVLSQRATADRKLQCLLLLPALGGREKLRHREPQAASGEAGIGGVAPLAGGSQVSVLGLNNHKNLQYICSAKRLNSCQALWALFLTRFIFRLSYHLGSRNTKPGALLKRFAVDEAQVGGPEPILPLPCMVASLTLDVEERVRVATATLPGPSS